MEQLPAAAARVGSMSLQVVPLVSGNARRLDARTSPLLDGVGQLVREQPLPGWLRRRKTAIVERNVLPDRVRASSDEPSALRRPGVGMHPNKAEVMPEAGLEERARLRIERPPRSVHDLLHDPRDVLFPPKPRPARRQSSNSYLYQLAQ